MHNLKVHWLSDWFCWLEARVLCYVGACPWSLQLQEKELAHLLSTWFFICRFTVLVSQWDYKEMLICPNVIIFGDYGLFKKECLWKSHKNLGTAVTVEVTARQWQWLEVTVTFSGKGVHIVYGCECWLMPQYWLVPRVSMGNAKISAEYILQSTGKEKL